MSGRAPGRASRPPGVLLLTVTLAVCGPPAPPAGTTLLLTDVRVFDARAGTFGEPTDVAVGGERILGMGRVGRTDPQLARIDGEGGFLLPALQDSHVHLSFLTLGGDSVVAETLRSFVDRGVLHVRDVGGPLEVVADMGRRVASGEWVGPRISFAGPMAEKPPLDWGRYNEVLPGFTVPMEREEDVDALVSSVADAGGTQLKVYNKWDRVLLRRLLDRARERGLAVVLDPGPPLFQDVPVDTALALGIRRIDHAIAGWQSVLRPELRARHDSLRTAGDPAARVAFAQAVVSSGVESTDPEQVARLAADWAREGAYFCPTLRVVEERRAAPPPVPGLADEAEVRRFWDGFADVGRLLTSALAEEGVRFLVGQDQMDPALTVEEIVLLAGAGLSPAEAILAATWNPSEWAGELHDLGSVEVGKRADLILVRESPLDDLTRLGRPWLVVQGGVVRVRGGERVE